MINNVDKPFFKGKGRMRLGECYCDCLDHRRRLSVYLRLHGAYSFCSRETTRTGRYREITDFCDVKAQVEFENNFLISTSTALWYKTSLLVLFSLPGSVSSSRKFGPSAPNARSVGVKTASPQERICNRTSSALETPWALQSCKRPTRCCES